MSRIPFVKVLAVALVAGAVAGGVEATDPPDPAEATRERIREVGSGLVDWIFARWDGAPDGSRADVEAAHRHWQAAAECAVPAGAAPMTAVELEAAWRERGGDPAELANFELDAWGRPLEIYFVAAALPERPRLLIRSAGANGVFERSTYEPGRFDEGAAEDDIVWAFESFCRQPKPEGCCEEPGDDAPLSADQEAQRRTMTDFRNLGTAILSWLSDQIDDAGPGADREATAIDRGNCPRVAGATEGTAHPFATPATHFGVLPPADAIEPEALERILRPSETVFYIREIPRTDGWGEPIEVYLHLADLYASKIVTIRSAGRDGEFETDCYEIGPFDPDDADQDIVWSDGFFVRWPGAQTAR